MYVNVYYYLETDSYTVGSTVATDEVTIRRQLFLNVVNERLILHKR